LSYFLRGIAETKSVYDLLNETYYSLSLLSAWHNHNKLKNLKMSLVTDTYV